MSEGQTKRRIGQGMKPRDKQEEKPAVIDSEFEEVPTEEGQPESIIEPVLARHEGEQSSDTLEPETVQNLDSAETAGVAQSDPLEQALADSSEVLDSIDQIEAAADLTGHVIPDSEAMPKRWPDTDYFLGPQPDGSYKIVTTIPEGYLQAVVDWANSDGVTVEEWVDRQLSGYLENWGSPAKGR